MTKRAYQSQFYADDKDVYDLIKSSERKITNRRLVAFLRQRGIILSEFEDREDLATYVSRLPVDWHMLTSLLQMADSPDRVEKLASQTVKVPCTDDQLRAALTELQKERQGVRDELYAPSFTPDGAKIDIEYTDFEPAKTRVNQRRQKQLSVRIERSLDGSALKIRHEANPRAREIVAKLTEIIGAKVGQPVEPKTVVLTGVREPHLRSMFFVVLMQSMPDFQDVQVSSLGVDRLAPPPEVEAAETEEDDDEADSGDKNSSSADAGQMIAVVNSVLLKGTALMNSEEYKQLTAKGLFVSHAVWRSRHKKTGVEYDFEAEFANGPEGTDFRYGVRGVYEKAKRGSGELKKGREQVKESDRLPLMLALEEAAQKALDTVTKKAASDSGGTVVDGSAGTG